MSFDVENFQNMEFQGGFDTVVVQAPVGEFPAQIADINFRKLEANDSHPERMIAEINCELLGPDIEKHKQEHSLEKVLCRHSLWLDTTPEGGLDQSRGKNIGLGRLLEAVGHNEKGQPIAFSKLVGKRVKVLTESKATTKGTFTQVKTVSKAE